MKLLTQVRGQAPVALLAAVLLAGLLLPAALPAGGMAHAQGAEPYGVVSLRITVQEYDAAAPWNKTPERMILGNAMVVEGGMLLTTADLVKNATLIEVRKFGRYPNFPAKPHLVDHEVDLALLTVDDPQFWKGLKPLPISERPVTSRRFEINRWRANGRFEQGSGEVVQLSVATSRYGNLELPELQGSTAMSAMGWGEVLTSQGKVIGIITGHEKGTLSAMNSPMMRLFIAASREETYRGFAHRGFSWQQLNQGALRKFYGLGDDPVGVLIRRTKAGGTGAGQLRKGDILLKLGAYEIDPEGRIVHPLYGPILFTIAINETLEPTIGAEIIRGGERKLMELRREPYSIEDYRVHPYIFDQRIDYEIFGGLVLQELSLGHLRLWGNNWQHKAPARLVMEYFLSNLRERGKKPEKIVFVSKVLPDSVNIGYDDAASAILMKANGKTLRSLADFRAAVRTPRDGYHVLELTPGKGRGKLIFRASEVEAANRRVRELYGVPEAQGKAATAQHGIGPHRP